MARKPSGAVLEDPTSPATETSPDAERAKRLVKPAEFWETVRSYPDTSGCWIYINRLFPEIVHQKGGHRWKHIERIDSTQLPSNGDYVFMKHGGGRYELYFNDSNKVPNFVARCFMDMSINEREPILNYVELVNTPNNAPYIQRLLQEGKIRIDENNEIVPIAAAPRPAEAESGNRGREAASERAAAEAMFGVVAETTKKFVEYTLNGNKPMSAVEMVTLAKELRGEQPNMMPIFTAMMQQQTALLQMVMTQKQPAAGDPVDRLDSTIGFLERLGERFGVNLPKPGGGTDWKEIAAAIAPALAPFALILANRMAGQTSTPTTEEPRPGTTLPSPAGNSQPQNDQYAFLRKLARLLETCLSRGIGADSFAVTIDTEYGNDVYQQLIASGKEGLMQALQMVPEIWSRFEPKKAVVEKFIEDFLATASQEQE